MAGKIGRSEKLAFRDLLLLDTVRGVDSTGVVGINEDNSSLTAKEVGLPDSLFKYDCFDIKGLWKGTPKVLIGHNRAATLGSVTKKNAHPFHCGSVYGAHNGTLERYQLWRLEDHTSYEVDSEALIHTIDKIGLEKALEKTAGAYALTLFDTATEELQIIRNDKRPLYITFSDDGDTMFWASEYLMLTIALGRNGVTHTEPVSVPEDTYLSMKISKAEDVKVKNLIYGKKMEGFKQPVYSYRSPVVPYKAPVRTNVVPFNNLRKKVWKDERAEMPKKGEVLEVSFTGQELSQENLTFLKGTCNRYSDLELRLYVNENSDHSDLLEGLYSITVKSLKSLGNTKYVVLHRKTISRSKLPLIIDVKSNTEEKSKFASFLGEVDKKVWESLTKNGCAHCDDTADERDQGNYTWFSKDEYLCEDCAPLYDNNLVAPIK